MGRRPAAVTAARGKVLVLKIVHCCEFAAVSGGGRCPSVVAATFLLLLDGAFCFGIHCAYSYPEQASETYMPSARRSLGRNDWRGVFLLC